MEKKQYQVKNQNGEIRTVNESELQKYISIGWEEVKTDPNPFDINYGKKY